MPSDASLRRRLEDRIRQETTAEARFDDGSRRLYSTDASLYEIEPLGAVLPRSAADVAQVVRIAADLGVPIISRGAATSLSGQTVGTGIVLDVSKYLNRIGIVDRDRGLVRVEPGVVLDQLNAHLKPLGLMFGPDVSTSDRATLGGMIGNNSAGARSLRYGKTVDHVHSLDVVLADGTPATFGPLDNDALASLASHQDPASRIQTRVHQTVASHQAAIAAAFPRILRRVSGYNLDELIPGLAIRPPGWPDEPFQFNLARLIVGSEGTLAVVTGALLKVVPAPKHQGLVVLSFATIPAALDRLDEIVSTGPVAVEMVDRTILDLAAQTPALAGCLSFATGHPEAVLAAQFYDDDADSLAQKASDLAERFEGRPGVLGVRVRLADAARDDFWKVRKAGLSLLMGMVGDDKPVAFVEDTAVSPEKLPAFYDRFRQIVAAHGVRAACYGHADVGCLHIRPILNMKTELGVDRMRGIAAEVSALVSEFGGAMSGEHGDGLARSAWNRPLFGEDVHAAFREVKAAFDPHNLLNPGKVVGSPDLAADLRIGPGYRAEEPPSTAFDFSSQGGFARAVELCSGVGACRKTATGTMCPSYMVTRDEEHSTRGRANLLRAVMAGQIDADGLSSPALDEALDLCLQCKACKTECPSGVDMAKLKAEVLHQSSHRRPLPLRHRLLGNIHRLNPLASAVAPLSNWLGHQKPLKILAERLLGIDLRRTLPAFHRDNLRRWFRRHPIDSRAGQRGTVILIDDCFTTYNAPSAGIAAVRLLEAAGFTVRLAGMGCCGRAAISKGLLTLARELAEQSVSRLVEPARQGIPILGIEPSCLVTFIDEYRDFRLGPDAETVAQACRLVDDFLGDPSAVPELPLNPRPGPVLLHGHCHQKALLGTAGTRAALARVPGLQINELDSGCCGMAGSFGYEHGHYEISAALAARVLLPALAAYPGTPLIAPGFSCRSQVQSLAGVEALHTVEFLAGQLQQ